MNINPIHRVGASNPYQHSQELKAGDKPRSKQKDDVQISSEAKQMAAMEQPGRSEKINELKRSVENGTYNIDSRDIAEKLLKYWKS